MALLIDGENVSAAYAGRIIMRALGFGALVTRRVYGHASRIPQWDEAPGFRVVHAGGGKNAADVLLAIEAVELFHVARPSTFVLVSKDGDFTHLATHLRERGATVVGMGEAHAAERFRKACTRFEILELPQAPKPADATKGAGPDAPAAAAPRPPEPSGLSRTTSAGSPAALPPDAGAIDKAIRRICQRHGGPAARITLARLGALLPQEEQIRREDCGFARWRSYLATRPDLYRIDGSGHDMAVTLVGAER
ncbi:NYN domain-containing protein [Cereibacter sphaeroides]|uniref:NYN domain-containing protein n=1 Tax=Cereibacter sphaeroides TaxID=1063 RepID=UPI001F432DC4|nr:NYN domain-containing protein [Cereibacter sphaeroides]MCE6950001.1 NYN domain-containing protein [Cereibacter sphaeroides]MCE6958448.1 NYN domain-containing protein [Cereibacter sphaeroides]MCE6967762.1 NYN domain-containing protein [Cereibacter sphaeroides]MCE6972653.1 NYN domain-containing protein [Cereibacter sphaeroides]